jgi:enamine deaminase RidA (YjgF/YER057c/UK114 family)
MSTLMSSNNHIECLVHINVIAAHCVNIFPRQTRVDTLQGLFNVLESYSQAVRIGNTIKTSGQGGWDESGNVHPDVEQQVAVAFQNVEKEELS